MNETKKFLKALDPTTDEFTFQTFDDTDKKDKSLVRILHGTLEQHWSTLAALNKKGAGIYITVNATDLKGRKTENITRVRHCFVDLDGAPLAPAKQPKPHIIVESSPKRWHVYWRIADMPLEAFAGAQRKLIKRLNSDKSIHDLPRVLRLPGFIHQKGKPFKTKLVEIWDGEDYKAKEFVENTPAKKKAATVSNLPPIEIDEILAALEVIPADEYPIWWEVGCALAHELGDVKGKEVWDRWSRKSAKYDKRLCNNKWEECLKIRKFTAGTIFHYATEADPTWRDPPAIPEGSTVEDFVSFLPKHDYIYTLTGQHWPASSVNSQLPKQTLGDKRIKASEWLDRNRQVQAITWSPGEPEMITDRIARAEGGWIERTGTMCLNTYRAPMASPAGNAGQAGHWLKHLQRLYPEDWEHLVGWFALRVQKPGVKINHGLIVGGSQGIGKDMILKPVRQAVGVWNTVNVSPKDIMSSFNTYVRSVLCQIDEARDLGGTRSYDFYEHLKTLTTAPPDILQCNEKHVSPYAVMNVTGVVITTNHRTGGVFLPPGDRRFYVAWSECIKEEFTERYFSELEAFYINGGYGHVEKFLRAYDVKGFNPKAPPKQTVAWRDMVEAGIPQEDAEFGEAIDILEKPAAFILSQIMKVTPSNGFANWLGDRKNFRNIAHRLESCGYIAIRNPQSAHNRWRYTVHLNGKMTQREVVIYGKMTSTIKERERAANELLLKLRELSSD